MTLGPCNKKSDIGFAVPRRAAANIAAIIAVHIIGEGLIIREMRTFWISSPLIFTLNKALGTL